MEYEQPHVEKNMRAGALLFYWVHLLSLQVLVLQIVCTNLAAYLSEGALPT
jgi:hypothetical protein